MIEGTREFKQIFRVLFKNFFIFLSVLGIDISNLEYPPSESQIMILNTVLDSDSSYKLRVVIRFCIRYFNLRNIPLNKRLGCILYLLIQCNAVEGIKHQSTISEETLTRIVGNKTFHTSKILLPWVKDDCDLQCPHSIIWDNCSINCGAWHTITIGSYV